MNTVVHTYRKIIHIDMDAFYASVEQRDHPEFRGKPIAVGGSPEGRGGVVATASYEARKFGVRSAMSSKKAQQLCKDLIFVRPRFEAYKAESLKIRSIFQRYTDLIEPLSLDEAFLDVTTDKLNIGSALEIALQIKQSIKQELHLTASAGISINKFVAKIASDMNKPDGFTFIGPSKIERFMEQLPVEKFFGVGKVTAQKMKALGLHTGIDLKRLSENELVKHFGKSGRFFYHIVRGIDTREVRPDREIKSIGAEDTFPFDLTTLAEMDFELDKLAMIVRDRLKRNQLQGRTITLKIKYHDFKIRNKSISLVTGVSDHETMASTAKALLRQSDWANKKIRLLGISISNFQEPQTSIVLPESEQLPLF